MTRKQRRLSVIAGLGVVLALAVGLILFALRDQIVFFYSPTEIHEKAVAGDGSFAATNVLAKHDEKYMPKEVVDELKAKGEWQRGEAGG